MTQWERKGFSKKTKSWALMACLLLVSFVVDGAWLDDNSSNRKRVFSPGFVTLCIFVVTLELLILNGMYGHAPG